MIKSSPIVVDLSNLNTDGNNEDIDSFAFNTIAEIGYSTTKDLAKISIIYEDERGSEIVFDDTNLDGTAEAHIADNHFSGKYSFKSATAGIFMEL